MAQNIDWHKQEPLKRFLWPIRVYIEDTDAGGIVFYVNYLKFMERARTESLRTLGFGKQFILGKDSMFVVHSLQVDYKKPAELDEELVVEAHVMQIKRTSIVFRQNIYRRQENENALLCAASVKIACVSSENMKPSAIPAEILTAFQSA